MKLIQYTILGLLLITFTACSGDDDGIYFDETARFEEISYSDIEIEIFDLVNDYREQNGLSQLSILNTVTLEAITHSSYMVEKGVPSHDNFSQRYANLSQNSGATKVSENVAFGYRTAEAVVLAWLRSDSHRKIIENEDFTDFGLSIKEDHTGMKYYTHIFIKR